MKISEVWNSSICAAILSTVTLISLIFASLQVKSELDELSSNFNFEYKEFLELSDNAWKGLKRLGEKEGIHPSSRRNFEKNLEREKRHIHRGYGFASVIGGGESKSQCSKFFEFEIVFLMIIVLRLWSSSI